MPEQNNSPYNCNVITGEALLKQIKPVKDFQKRESYANLKNYLNHEYYGKVFILYGLRRTGKTTMMYQAIQEIANRKDKDGKESKDFSKCALVMPKYKDNTEIISTVKHLWDDLTLLEDQGFEYVFIDEITYIEGAMPSSFTLSDSYAQRGMKIVLSGTDSLKFRIAQYKELYDRCIMLHTTYIPFREYSRLLKVNDIDKYIEYGGTLVMERDQKGNSEGHPFKDPSSTVKYVDSAICDNIQHGLKEYPEKAGKELLELSQNGQFKNIVNRIIQKMNGEFTLDAVRNDFKAGDLELLIKHIKLEDNNRIKDVFNMGGILKRFKRMLGIIDKKNGNGNENGNGNGNELNNQIKITPSHIKQIKKYLMELDLIDNISVESIKLVDGEIDEVCVKKCTVFTQPGMRYCHTKEIVKLLEGDEKFKGKSKEKQTNYINTLNNGILGLMMENIILFETQKALDSTQYDAFKVKFIHKQEAQKKSDGEFDMLIYDKKNNTCKIYEIKHSNEVAYDQCRHLIDDEKRRITTERYGKITETCVIYRGEDRDANDKGVVYRNVQNYLKSLNPAQIKKIKLNEIQEENGEEEKQKTQKTQKTQAVPQAVESANSNLESKH